MKAYKSHKVVEAAKVVKVNTNYDVSNDTIMGQLVFEDASTANVDQAWMLKHAPGSTTVEEAVQNLAGGYFVSYPDGYSSWSPAQAFEEGYTEHSLDPKDGALPVSGYKPQSPEKVALVNGFKADEERLLRQLDTLAMGSAAEADRRWLAIGRTKLEEAFMAINRAVFQPGRARLPEDSAPGTAAHHQV